MRPTIPSILPFNPNLHQLLKPLQCQPRFSGRQRLRHLSGFQQIQVSKAWKNSPRGFTAGVGNDFQTRKKLIQRTLAGGTNKNTTSMTHDRLDDQYLFNFSAPKDIKGSCFLHSEKEKRKLDRIPTSLMASPSRDNGSWPDSCDRTMMKSHAPLTTRPFKFCCPSGDTCHFQCGFTWHLQFLNHF